jgi:tetratricopeptide (TPR) repeat protein
VDLLEEAYNFCETGEYEKALKCYDKVLQKDQNNIKALIDKGVTLQNLGNLKESLSLYDRAL